MPGSIRPVSNPAWTNDALPVDHRPRNEPQARRPPRVAMGDTGGPFCARVQPFTAEAKQRQPATVKRIEHWVIRLRWLANAGTQT